MLDHTFPCIHSIRMAKREGKREGGREGRGRGMKVGEILREKMYIYSFVLFNAVLKQHTFLFRLLLV